MILFDMNQLIFFTVLVAVARGCLDVSPCLLINQFFVFVAIGFKK
jgi:hypothetical protein